MSQIKELKLDIAASLFLYPCDYEELRNRDFLKTKSDYGIELMLSFLENDGASYIKKNKIHIKKSWAKKNLKEYGLDFRTDREKEIDSMSDFAKQVYGFK